jgi:transposase
VAAAREVWKNAQPLLDPKKLVFIDETGTATNMTRLRGRCLRGKRLVSYAPRGHWKMTTYVAALRCDRVTAPLVLDGPMNSQAFLAYIEQFVLPTLSPGDIVSMDNLSSHKSAAVRTLIESVGASLRYLPAYSPDLNPIEMLFAQLKAYLRKAKARSVEALWTTIGRFIETVTQQQCANYFAHDGYGST